MTLEYVKHVGSSAYVGTKKNLPEYAFTSLCDYDFVDFRWQPNNGGWYSVSLVELDPVIKTYQREGLVVATVYSGMRRAAENDVGYETWPWRTCSGWIAPGMGGTGGGTTTGSEGPAGPALSSDDTENQEPVPDEEAQEYILPDSGSRLYSKEELKQLSEWELFVARTEVFARYGRGFKNQDLTDHFASCSWYEKRFTPEEFDAMESPLNEYEKANVEAIRAVEEEKGSPYLS